MSKQKVKGAKRDKSVGGANSIFWEKGYFVEKKTKN